MSKRSCKNERKEKFINLAKMTKENIRSGENLLAADQTVNLSFFYHEVQQAIFIDRLKCLHISR